MDAGLPCVVVGREVWKSARSVHVLSSAIRGRIHIKMVWNRWLNGRGTLDVGCIGVCTGLTLSVGEKLWLVLKEVRHLSLRLCIVIFPCLRPRLTRNRIRR